MKNKLIRSGAPHSVTFNEVTHNALSPDNDLSIGEKKEISTEIETVPVDTLTTNNAKLDDASLLDDNFYREGHQRYENNNQLVNESEASTNRQKFADDVISENIQTLGAAHHIEKNFVYLGKENNKDHYVVIDSPKEKSASIQTCQESDKTLSSHMFKSHSSIDSSTMQTNQQHTDQRQEVHQAETDNHLREKIKLMKEKLHKANQELIHIQDQDKNSSQDL